MSELQSPVTELLKQKKIGYSVIEIPMSEDKKPIRNLEEWLQNQGCDPHSVVRSLLFKTGSDKFGGRTDWGVLRKQLCAKELRMAEFSEVFKATGYVVGAVPPIALPDEITVLVDKGINNFDEIIIGSGVLGYALALTSADLKSLLENSAVGEFVKD